jgi:hypothetical protein
MTRSIVALVLLTGCTMDEPVNGAPAASIASLPSPTPDGLTADELSRMDVRGTASSMAMISGEVQKLSPEEQAQAAESLRILSVNDPYTRSAMQLPFALHAVVTGIAPERLDPLVQRDWRYLQEGLAAHVAVLEVLGVDLPEPALGDHLHGRAQGLMVSRDILLAKDDPIGVTAALIHEIPALAGQVEEPSMELINRHSDRVERVTGVGRPCPRGPWATLPGQPWTLGMQIGGWHDALRRVEPFVQDPAVKLQIDAMIEVLDEYAQASLA